MTQPDSLDAVLNGLRQGDDDAAEAVFRRFSRRLIALAQSRMDTAIQGKVDPEDVIQSVFRSFFSRYAEGRLKTDDWSQIWTVLTVITVRKCRNKQQHYRAQCRDVGRERWSAKESAELWDAMSRDPTPDQAAMLLETLETVLAGASSTQRAILTMHLEGWSVAEISRRLERTERTVRRTLQGIRDDLRLL